MRTAQKRTWPKLTKSQGRSSVGGDRTVAMVMSAVQASEVKVFQGIEPGNAAAASFVWAFRRLAGCCIGY